MIFARWFFDWVRQQIKTFQLCIKFRLLVDFSKKKLNVLDIMNLNMFSQFYFGDSDFGSDFKLFFVKGYFHNQILVLPNGCWVGSES
jgi:hypothetical protein